ncbi:hypothetical protein GCM10007079_21600 [Nocardiopsis terrae]|uniref:Quinol monooxygenase YgiN n=1 Tax=Nocardiopsis terrae TaxID=372655 RepID=A0ABR9HGR9_9ACTN|nr:hypothetical protein [Nocardiopsis terrae]MBE1458228.1 hypothetical protein [Nocardiopsis terrae]GHC81530.1 hypothetical protein GCM10007079_21600 [Nocardiopsis terrae]
MPTAPEAPILFHNTMRVAKGHWEGFRLAARRAVDFTEKQAPQIMVEFFTDEANMLAHSFQLYADSASIRAHWRMSGSFINDVMDHCSVERLDVYGQPDAQVRSALEAFGRDLPVTVHPRLAGFTRFAGPSPDR